jgi:hypothetical protein
MSEEELIELLRREAKELGIIEPPMKLIEGKKQESFKK